MGSTCNCRRLAVGCILIAALSGCRATRQDNLLPSPGVSGVTLPSPSQDAREATSPAPPQDIFEVTFDGNECTLSGPTEIPTGEYRIPLNDQGHGGMYVWIGRVLEGRTWQDALDLQEYPSQWVPAPDWTTKAKITFHEYDAEIDRTLFTYEFEEAGEYQVWLENKSAMKLWPCAPFTVFGPQAD